MVQHVLLLYGEVKNNFLWRTRSLTALQMLLCRKLGVYSLFALFLSIMSRTVRLFMAEVLETISVFEGQVVFSFIT